MNPEELKQFLKEYLSIRLEIKENAAYFGQPSYYDVKVSLFLNDEEISKCEDIITIKKD